MENLHGVICLEDDITLVNEGFRVIAPDMVGFGKSDKYISTDDYSHQMHVEKMTQLQQ